MRLHRAATQEMCEHMGYRCGLQIGMIASLNGPPSRWKSHFVARDGFGDCTEGETAGAHAVLKYGPSRSTTPRDALVSTRPRAWRIFPVPSLAGRSVGWAGP
jgi:hypothetical protein